MTLTLPDYSSPNLQDTNPSDVPVAATLMRSPVFWMGFAMFCPIDIGEFLVVPNLHVSIMCPHHSWFYHVLSCSI